MSTHDIFICYSSKDEEQARDIVRYLEERQFRCWIACRDVRPGKNYQESIVQALRDAKILVFLFSDSSNNTGEVKKELCNRSHPPSRNEAIGCVLGCFGAGA